MAGSAGSPHVLTAYVCKHCDLPESHIGPGTTLCKPGLTHVLVPVEYVPREQSDALAEAVEAWDRDRMLDAVKAYREATAGEGGASG